MQRQNLGTKQPNQRRQRRLSKLLLATGVALLVAGLASKCGKNDEPKREQQTVNYELPKKKKPEYQTKANWKEQQRRKILYGFFDMIFKIKMPEPKEIDHPLDAASCIIGGNIEAVDHLFQYDNTLDLNGYLSENGCPTLRELLDEIRKNPTTEALEALRLLIQNQDSLYKYTSYYINEYLLNNPVSREAHLPSFNDRIDSHVVSRFNDSIDLHVASRCPEILMEYGYASTNGIISNPVQVALELSVAHPEFRDIVPIVQDGYGNSLVQYFLFYEAVPDELTFKTAISDIARSRGYSNLADHIDEGPHYFFPDLPKPGFDQRYLTSICLSYLPKSARLQLDIDVTR